MAVERPSWVWENDDKARIAFVEDCLSVLEGGHVTITRSHVAACADWALREHYRNTKLLIRQRKLKRAIARLYRMALHGEVRKTAP